MKKRKHKTILQKSTEKIKKMTSKKFLLVLMNE